MELPLWRQHDPVAYDADLGQWFVARYDDVRALLVDERLTPNRLHDFASRAPASAVAALRRHARWLIEPQRGGYRWIGPVVHSGLRASSTQTARASVAAASEQLARDLAARECFDIVADYAMPLSGWMLADFLGADRRDGARLVDWGLAITAFFADVDITTAATERMACAVRDLVAHARSVLDEPPQGTGERFLQAVARAAHERGRLLDDPVLMSSTLPLVTGYVDAAHLLATTIWLLLGHADQRARLAADPALAPAAVAEALRFGAPVALVARSALEPVVVAGHRIASGARLQLSLALANRDPQRFSDPDRFDLTRRQTGALGFGYGARSCVAAGVARSHAAIAVDTLLRHAPDLQADPDARPIWRPHRGIQALQSAPVRRVARVDTTAATHRRAT
jgi:cytochrome P450